MQIEPKGRSPQRAGRRPSVRSLFRTALITTVAALTFGLVAGATASAAPSVTVTPTTDLLTGQTITVEGADFDPVTAPPPPAPREGLYVAQAANVGGSWVVGSSQRWISYGASEPEDTLSPDGSFKTTVEASRFLGGGTVDCLKVQCVILTWQAHGNPGGPFNPIFTQTEIAFARSLSVDPRNGLSPTQATTVNVAGANYGPAIFPNGLKIAQAQRNGDSYVYGPAATVTTTPDPGDPSQFLLTADGYFAAEVEVAAKASATGGAIDCEFASCFVIAWPADQEPTGGTAGNVVVAEEIGFAFTYDPIVKLSQSRRLPATSDITVNGSGFPAGHPGLYVTQAVRIDGEYHTATRDFSGTASNMKFLLPGSSKADTRLNPDGSFQTVISVARTFALENGQQANCLEQDCFVITWRAHTNPSRATVYTASPVTFAPEVETVAPRINVVKRRQIRVGRSGRSLALAAVVCGSEACTVNRPNRAVLRVGKQRFRLELVGRKRAGAGKRAVVRLRLTGRAARALVGRSARVRFRVAARSESGNAATVVNRVLVGARKVNRRR